MPIKPVDGAGRMLMVLRRHLTCVQGDGTAVCLQSQPAAPTVSFHAASNFPARKQRSTADVPLPDGMGDDDFIRFGSCFSMARTRQLSVHMWLECKVDMAPFSTL